MSIAVVASTVAATTSSVADSDPINTTGADLIVLSISYYAPGISGDPPEPEDSLGNAWVEAESIELGIAGVRLYYCAAPTTGSGHTFSVPADTEGLIFPVLGVLAVSGADGSVSGTDSVTGTGTSISAGSTTPPADGALVVTGLCAVSASSDPAADGGFTSLGLANAGIGRNCGGGIAWLVQGAASLASPAWSWTTSTPSAAALAAFPAAEGGSSSSTLILTHPLGGLLLYQAD